MKNILNTSDSNAISPEVHQLPGESPLTDTERADFDSHREAIARTIEANADLIVRLIDIKQRKLYRDDHKTWENFCSTILRLTAVAVNNKIRAYEIRQTLQNGGVEAIILPTEDRPFRPLFSLKAEDHVACFSKAVEIANGAPITEEIMSRAVKLCMPEEAASLPRGTLPKAKINAQVMKLMGEMVLILPTVNHESLSLSYVAEIRAFREQLLALEARCDATISRAAVEQVAEPA